MSVFDELLANNAVFAASHPTDLHPAPPSTHLAVITCMDARITPLAVFGLETGDAHIIRNAGGRVTDDTLRSLIVSCHVLGVRAIAVVHHTECAMARHSQADLEAATGVTGIDFQAIADEAALERDVEMIRSSPMLPDGVEVHGFEYDIGTGRLRQVI